MSLASDDEQITVAQTYDFGGGKSKDGQKEIEIERRLYRRSSSTLVLP